MDLVEITSARNDVEIDLVYATEQNFTGKPVYRTATCLLHRDGLEALDRAVVLARALGLRFRIFDALRPSEAQWKLWTHSPNPEFLANPRYGSPHSRGIAVDLTLVDRDGQVLDMGTEFDAFTLLSHHGNLNVGAQTQRNRALLLGIMTSAGWDFYRNEWWHYQLFNSRSYKLLFDRDLPSPIM